MLWQTKIDMIKRKTFIFKINIREKNHELIFKTETKKHLPILYFKNNATYFFHYFQNS